MKGTQSLPPVVTVNNVKPDVNGNIVTYAPNNPPPYPVTSVDGKTGAVTTNAYTPSNQPPYPVTSVDGKTGAVTTNAYTPSNPPPYPVTKVNNKTGAVSLSASDVGAMASDKISFSLSGTTLTITVK